MTPATLYYLVIGSIAVVGFVATSISYGVKQVNRIGALERADQTHEEMDEERFANMEVSLVRIEAAQIRMEQKIDRLAERTPR